MDGCHVSPPSPPQVFLEFAKQQESDEEELGSVSTTFQWRRLQQESNHADSIVHQLWAPRQQLVHTHSRGVHVRDPRLTCLSACWSHASSSCWWYLFSRSHFVWILMFLFCDRGVFVKSTSSSKVLSSNPPEEALQLSLSSEEDKCAPPSLTGNIKISTRVAWRRLVRRRAAAGDAPVLKSVHVERSSESPRSFLLVFTDLFPVRPFVLKL